MRWQSAQDGITSTRFLAEKLQQRIDLIVNLTNEIPGLVFQYKRLPDGSACSGKRQTHSFQYQHRYLGHECGGYQH
jgi:hypothetical protein